MLERLALSPELGLEHWAVRQEEYGRWQRPHLRRRPRRSRPARLPRALRPTRQARRARWQMSGARYVPSAVERTFAGAEVFALGQSLTRRHGAGNIWRVPVRRAARKRAEGEGRQQALQHRQNVRGYVSLASSPVRERRDYSAFALTTTPFPDDDSDAVATQVVGRKKPAPSCSSRSTMRTLSAASPSAAGIRLRCTGDAVGDGLTDGDATGEVALRVSDTVRPRAVDGGEVTPCCAQKHSRLVLR